MMRGSAGGCVGGRTVTVITRDVTASGGLGTGSEVSSCQRVPRPSQESRRCFGWGEGTTRGQVQGEAYSSGGPRISGEVWSSVQHPLNPREAS